VAVELHERAERFTREMSEMRIADPSPGRHDLWARVGLGAMVVGLGVCLLAIGRSQGTSDAFAQRDAMALSLAGIAATIFGAAVYLRYSVTKVLRFWLARMSYDLQEHADRMAER
jgi:hypothetical protein